LTRSRCHSPLFIPFPPDLWNEPLRGEHQDTYRRLRTIWKQNAALSENDAEWPENELKEACRKRTESAPAPNQPDSETNDDRSQDQNRISRQQSQRQRQEPSQNQTPDEPTELTAQRLAPEIEKRQAEAAMKPWILLLTTCTANLALGNMEHSISVVINVCAAVLSTAQLLPSHVTPLPKRQAPACTTAKSTFKMPSGTIITALLGMIHSATARRGGIADALTPERRILPILRELPGHGTVLVLACILLITFAAVCCYYCHQATRGATAHLEPGTLNDMDQLNAMELGLLQPECQTCAKSPRHCSSSTTRPTARGGRPTGQVSQITRTTTTAPS
jgi:hypothetical protein